MATLIKKNVHSFARDSSGAVTVDWVVLSAAIVGFGIASVGSVRTGTDALGGSIESSLSSASVALFELDGFEFTFHNSTAVGNILDAFRARTDENLVENPRGQTNRFNLALAGGDFAEAQRWLERRRIHERVLRERGLTPAGGISSAEMAAALAAANPG